jgi:hypothetical protein
MIVAPSSARIVPGGGAAMLADGASVNIETNVTAAIRKRSIVLLLG